MSAHHWLLDLDDVVEGMTLADPVFDDHGGMLLPRGTILTNAMLLSVRRRGIDQLVVLDDTVSDADLAEERERLQQRLALLFRRCDDQGSSALLLQSITQYRLGGEA